FLFFFQAEDGIRDRNVTGVQTCALPISPPTRQVSPAYTAPFHAVPGRTLVPRVRPGTAWNGAVYAGDTWRVGGGLRLTYGARLEIGRASCRGRVSGWVVGGGSEKKTGGL